MNLPRISSKITDLQTATYLEGQLMRGLKKAFKCKHSPDKCYWKWTETGFCGQMRQN